MKDASFSSSVKLSLCDIKGKRGCCRKTEKDFETALSEADFKDVAECADRFLCEDCAASYVRKWFLHFGTVTDPNKSYHLEMSFPDEALRDRVFDVLSSVGIIPKKGMRRDRYIVYYKNSESIEDFLALIGATSAVYEMANLKLMKEATISINRQNNFETANMKKTAEANYAYVAAINYLIESGNFDNLPEDLIETGSLRIKNDTASMAELGRMHSPSISKSGVKHRLDRLVAISDGIKNRNSH